jgi:hypothetical protein
MRKRFLPKILLWISFTVVCFTACVDDSDLALPPAIPDQSFVEEFDTLQSAYNRGWRFLNRSVPIGPTNWEQASAFNAYSSKGGNFGHVEQSAFASRGTSPQGLGVISNWIISPPLTIQSGDKIIFYTRDDHPEWIDRLQVRLNANNESVECGYGREVGNFDIPLLDINPKYLDDPSLGGYPDNWTRFEVTVVGLQTPKKGRFAFRAFIEGGGPGNNERGSTIGIDSVAYISKR